MTRMALSNFPLSNRNLLITLEVTFKDKGIKSLSLFRIKPNESLRCGTCRQQLTIILCGKTYGLLYSGDHSLWCCVAFLLCYKVKKPPFFSANLFFYCFHIIVLLGVMNKFRFCNNNN